jgi:hypothetical protein
LRSKTCQGKGIQGLTDGSRRSGNHRRFDRRARRLADALDMKLVFGFEVNAEDADSEPTRNLVVVP